MTVKFTNNASSTVATAINTTATSLVVTSAAGFPTLSGSGDYCYLTIQQAAGLVREVVKATALSGSTFTIVRAQDGTSAGSWSVSDVVEVRVTAALLTDIVDAATHDSSVLSVDSTNNRVGVNDTTPSVTLDISGTDAIALPVGTTAQRPSAGAGRFRYNSSLSQFEGYTDAWGAIGGGGTNTFTTDSFTANGSLVAFNLSQTVSSKNNLLVFIDGVFQTQDAYAIATASGTTTLTFSAAPANARKIVVYSVAAGISGANLNIDSMTGDGSDVTLTLTISTIKANTQVFIDGVYQAKANYSISGTTLTFSTAPPAGSAVECVTMTQTEINVPVDGTITSAKLSGALTTPSTLTATGKITADAGIDIDNFNIDGTTIALSSGDLTLDVAGRIILDADNAGTIFIQDAGTIYGVIEKSSDAFVFRAGVSDGDILFKGNDGGSTITALTLDMSDGGTATFNSHVRLGDNKTASFGAGNDIEITSDGTNGTIGAPNGNLTLDVAGRIILDADTDGDVRFLDGGTQYGQIFNVSSDLYIRSNIQDKDIIFNGNDNGNFINALTLDMSAAGSATFNSTVTASKLVSANGVLELDDNGSHNGIVNSPASLHINIDSDNSATNETFIIAKDRTSTTGGTVLYSISEAGNAEQKGTSSADLRIIAATDNATITLQAGASDSGAEAAMIYYLQNTTYKWEVGMKSDNSFRWHSYAAGAEVLQINPNGRLGLGVAAQSNIQLKVLANGQLHGGYFLGNNAGYANIICDNADGGGARHFIQFHISGSVKGSITSTGSVMVYGGTSDYRLKENVVELTSATTRLKRLNPKRFNFIGDSETVDGFIAHEVDEVVPAAVVGEKDAVDDEGNIKAQQMDNSLLVPLLVATIKELEARITALENN